MAIKTFTTGEVLTASDTNTYLANSGLVYVNSYTFTGQTFVDFTISSVFSSTYDNYRVVWTLTNSIAGNFYYLKFPGSTGSTYNNVTPYWTYGSTTQTNNTNASSATGIPIGLTTLGFDTGSMDIYAPNIARATGVTGQSTNGTYPSFFMAQDANAAAQTGITFANTGPHRFTAGKVVIYGYRIA